MANIFRIDRSANTITLGTTGTITSIGFKHTAGSFSSPIDVTSTRQYGIELHYSGNNYNATAIRARAHAVTTDTAAQFQGGLFQAANNDNINVGVLNGLVAEAIGKATTNAATITMMRGALVGAEWSAKDTVTDLRTLHVRVHTRDAATEGYISGTGYGIYIENEAVGGNGQVLDAGIYFKGTSLSAGNKAFTYGLDFSGATYGTTEIKFADGSYIGSTGAVLSGHLALGGAAIDANAGIKYNEVLTDTDNSNKYGLYLKLEGAKTASAFTSVFTGVRADVNVDATNTQNWTFSNIPLRGFSTTITTESGGSGTIAGAAGLVIVSDIRGGPVITNLYGVHIFTPSWSSGDITNLYGIYIQDQGAGDTLNYAIYTNAGLVRLGDDTTISGTLKTGDGGATNYAAFAADGSQSFNGTARINWTKIAANGVTIRNSHGTTSDSVSDLQTAHDGNVYTLSEESGETPGMDIEVDFTGVTAFNWVQILARYEQATAGHGVTIMLEVSPFNGTAWHRYDFVQDQGADLTNEEHSFFVPDDTAYINSGVVKVRFVHEMIGTSANHDLVVDVCALYQ